MSAVAFPQFPDNSKWDYYDRNDTTGHASGDWAGRELPPGHNPRSKREICPSTWEHKECVVNVAGLCELNRKRREARPEENLPLIKFYAIVQHEGEAVILKRHNPRLVVSIGMSYGVTTCLLEPQHAIKLWDNQEGKRVCNCVDGIDEGERPDWTLELRDLKDNPKAGMEETLY